MFSCYKHSCCTFSLRCHIHNHSSMEQGWPHHHRNHRRTATGTWLAGNWYLQRVCYCLTDLQAKFYSNGFFITRSRVYIWFCQYGQKATLRLKNFRGKYMTSMSSSHEFLTWGTRGLGVRMVCLCAILWFYQPNPRQLLTNMIGLVRNGWSSRSLLWTRL